MSLERVIAAAFRQTRKEQLQRSHLIYFLSLERRWMSREQAGALIDRALEKGLLGEKGGLLFPRFDPLSVEIPLGYRPGSEVFEEEPHQALLERIARTTKRPLQEVTKELNELMRTHFDGHLRAEAGVLLLAKKHRVPFEDLLDRLRAKVKEKG